MNNQVANEYIDRLKEDSDVLGIILFGSWARGNNRPDSDIDLLVIKKEGFMRTVEVFKTVNFEITYTTKKGAIEFWTDNPNDCVDVWKSGQVLFDRDGTMGRLKEFARKLESEGKKPLNETTKEHLIFDVNDQLNGITFLIEKDPASAALLLNKQVLHLCELYFDFKQLWTPAPKQFIAEIEKTNPSLASWVRDFFKLSGTLETKWQLARKIADIVITGKHN